jgi:hypothetical protein
MKVDFMYRKPRELTAIADSFNVRPMDIRLWNHLQVGAYPKDSTYLSVYMNENDYNKFFGIVKVEEKTPDSSLVKVKEEVKTEPVIKDKPVTEN